MAEFQTSNIGQFIFPNINGAVDTPLQPRGERAGQPITEV